MAGDLQHCVTSFAPTYVCCTHRLHIHLQIGLPERVVEGQPNRLDQLVDAKQVILTWGSRLCMGALLIVCIASAWFFFFLLCL